MRKYEDDAMKLAEMVAKNSHDNAAKSFGRGVPAKEGMIDAKLVQKKM